ncbi:integrase [Pandoraea sputorum]|uniref:Integrase n=1 Tax=Pandoraea sputorum TaxID=93222 RepID=A0A5E5BJT8_9BURK|nr:integrase [Pandoraea sputorum]
MRLVCRIGGRFEEVRRVGHSTEVFQHTRLLPTPAPRAARVRVQHPSHTSALNRVTRASWSMGRSLWHPKSSGSPVAGAPPMDSCQCPLSPPIASHLATRGSPSVLIEPEDTADSTARRHPLNRSGVAWDEVQDEGLNRRDERRCIRRAPPCLGPKRERRFWQPLATVMTSETAAQAVGASCAVGARGRAASGAPCHDVWRKLMRVVICRSLSEK